MTRTALLAAAAMAALPGLAMAEPQQLYMDPNHTQIRAEWDHFTGAPLVIMFTEYDATVMYDPEDVSASSVEIALPISGLESGVPPFNEHLSSPDFFEAAAYPEASFVSTGIVATGETTAEMTGDLTIKDTTAPVTFAVTLLDDMTAMGRRMVGFTATTTLDRTEWGLGMFAPAVPAEVDLTIVTELLETDPAAAE